MFYASVIEPYCLYEELKTCSGAFKSKFNLKVTVTIVVTSCMPVLDNIFWGNIWFIYRPILSNFSYRTSLLTKQTTIYLEGARLVI